MSGTLAQVSHSVAEMPPALMMTARFSISLRTNFADILAIDARRDHSYPDLFELIWTAGVSMAVTVAR